MFDFKCFSKEFVGMRTGEMKITTEDSQSALTEAQCPPTWALGISLSEPQNVECFDLSGPALRILSTALSPPHSSACSP